MKLRSKQTGKILYVTSINYLEGDETILVQFETESGYPDSYTYESLEELSSAFEDYEPVEPIFDEKIRKGIRAWWDMQDNPFKAASVYCSKKKDLDGFYHWRIFGYIRDGEQKESTDLCFRTKKLYEFEDFKDYTKQELCGEEEE